ncbi:MAG: hypothetical protein ABI679_12230 [Gemmatimonadota bacterium]
MRTRFAMIATLLASTPLHGQLPDTSYAGRVLSALARKLDADATLPESFRRLTPPDLARTMDTGHFDLLLDDPSLNLYVRTMAATLHQVPDSVCGAMLLEAHGQTHGAVMLGYVDSMTAANWGTVFERVIRARATSATGGRVGSTEEVQAAMLGIFGALSETDRARLMAISTHPPPTAPDMCWAARMIADGIAGLPSEQLAPVSRAMSAGSPN